MTADRTVCLTIDNQEIRCPVGFTVYEAATAAGIHIPTFCHHEKLVPVGACRMCLVEIEGARGLQTSCTTPVREGMVVKVQTSPAAVKARKANIEFLLTNHPLDCPVCDKGGECPLQDQAMLDGPGESRYVEEKRHKNKRYPLSELIVIDQERCVLCWRCIRFLDEWADDHELDLFGRGAETRISTFPGRPLKSKWQGNTIDVCPVGALTSRVFRFEARVWELTNTPSICPMCSVGCNTVLGAKNNELRRITPRENLHVNDVWICDKGRFAHGFVDHPERLTGPLVRRDGQLQPASWDEALDLVACRFKEIVEIHGPQAIGGLGSTRVTNEANYLFQRFMRTVIGGNNVDHLGRMPDGAVPLHSLPELEHKDVIVLLGVDPSTESPLVELWIKKAVLRHGATLVIANPRRIELARYGGPWLGHRPGSEAALLNGLARSILEAGWENQAARVTNMEEYRTWLAAYAPEQVARLTSVPANVLRLAAESLGRAIRPIILYGPDWAGDDNGRTNLAALGNLSLLLAGLETAFLAEDNNTLGALDMGVVPDLYPGRQPFEGGHSQVRSRLSGLWGARLSPVPGLGVDGMMAAAQEGDLKAVWIMGTDPVRESQIARSVLQEPPFLVVQDMFLTDTALQAEVVLPAAGFAETDGSFTSLTGRLQRVHRAKRPPGEARPDVWIILELAKRMVAGKQRRAWDFAGPAEVWNEIAKVVPGYRGVDYDAMGSKGWQPPAPQPVVRRSFIRAEAKSPPCTPEYPLTLITGRRLYDRGTLLSRSARVQNHIPDAFVVIHPGDAAALGIVEGDLVSVVSSVGRLEVAARIRDDIAPGVVFLPLNLGDVPESVLIADRRTRPCVRIDK
jgi:NADH-quinone oxidoreductase chain G